MLIVVCHSIPHGQVAESFRRFQIFKEHIKVLVSLAKAIKIGQSLSTVVESQHLTSCNARKLFKQRRQISTNIVAIKTASELGQCGPVSFACIEHKLRVTNGALPLAVTTENDLNVRIIDILASVNAVNVTQGNCQQGVHHLVFNVNSLILSDLFQNCANFLVARIAETNECSQKNTVY